MFLRQLIRRNPGFLKAAVQLHQAGKIPANSYVLDLDTLEANARLLAAEGQRLGMKVFPMTKQIGRNPFALRAMARAGLDAFVAVDMGCAWPIHSAGYGIGHIGHLVQIPQAETAAAAAMRPYYWTVYNDSKAAAASEAAAQIGRAQPLLARIYAPGDTFYMGHEGGYPAGEVVQVADSFDRLPGGRFAGIVTFPALLFDSQTQQVKATPNLCTLERAAEALRQAGRSDLEINAPGTTSKAVLPILAAAGATQVEPGHGLTGTTPLHAVQDLPEQPAVLYLSEVSHFHNGRAYCFGGGLYIDPVFPNYEVRALIGSDPDTLLERAMPVELPPANAIDYYGLISPSNPVEVGDTVLFGFRIQAFVTRAFVVPVSGLSIGQPVVEGVFTADGRRAGWPQW